MERVTQNEENELSYIAGLDSYLRDKEERKARQEQAAAAVYKHGSQKLPDIAKLVSDVVLAVQVPSHPLYAASGSSSTELWELTGNGEEHINSVIEGYYQALGIEVTGWCGPVRNLVSGWKDR